MTFKSIILGIAATVALLAVLVATRLMVLSPVEHEFEIREIETVSLPEPPSPQEEPLLPEDSPPPPPPVMEDLRPAIDMSQPVILISNQAIDPRLSIDAFFTDQPPAPLPDVEVVQPKVAESAIKSKPRPQVKSALPQPKSEFSLGELDQQPRLLRNPSVIFPRSIKDASSGSVVVRVAILASGRSEFISVVSSTHEDLVPLAKRIASGSRFTPPTRQGKAVKAIMTWPITIKK